MIPNDKALLTHQKKKERKTHTHTHTQCSVSHGRRQEKMANRDEKHTQVLASEAT